MEKCPEKAAKVKDIWGERSNYDKVADFLAPPTIPVRLKSFVYTRGIFGLIRFPQKAILDADTVKTLQEYNQSHRSKLHVENQLEWRDRFFDFCMLFLILTQTLENDWNYAVDEYRTTISEEIIEWLSEVQKRVKYAIICCVGKIRIKVLKSYAENVALK